MSTKKIINIIFNFVVKLISHSPRWSYGLLALLIAPYIYILAPNRLANAKINLARIYHVTANTAIVKSTAWKMNYNYLCYLTEHLAINNLKHNYSKLVAAFDNKDVIDHYYQQGKGIILVSAHIGNWEVGAAALAMMGYKVTVVAETQFHPIISESVKQLKTKLNINVVSSQNLRSIVRDLNNGHIIGLVVDGDVFSGGKEVTFLNNRLMFPQGPEKLCRRYNVPIIFGYSRRLSNGMLTMSIDRKVITSEECGDITQMVANRINKYILNNLDQWEIYRKLWA